MNKITLFALMLLALLTMSFLITSVYAEIDEDDAVVYRNVRWQVFVEEFVGQSPLAMYDGTGRVKVSYEDGQLKLRLIVDGRGSLPNGRKIIELEPRTWRYITDQWGYQIAAGSGWLYYTRTNVTWLGNGKPLREEGKCMGFSFRYYFFPEHNIPNLGISIAEMPANDWQQSIC